MEKGISFFVLLVSLLIIGSCVAPATHSLLYQPKYNKGLAPRIFDSTSINGVIFGNISLVTTNKLTWGEYYVKYIKEDGWPPTNYSIDLIPKGLGTYQPTYKKNDTLVYEFVLEHEPGTYEFTKLIYLVPSAQGYAPKEDRSIIINPQPIKIEKGKINYVGDLIIKKHGDHKAFFVDKYKRDLKHFSKKYRNLDWSLINEYEFVGFK